MKKIVFYTVIIGTGVLSITLASAQTPDTLKKINIENFTDRMENIASGTDMSLDYSDLIDDYLYYEKNPLNLNNQDDIEKLVELRLINRKQADNLRVYILKWNYLATVYELKFVEGFDNKTISLLEPFVTAQTPEKREKTEIKNVFKYGKHKIIARFGSLLQTPEGYLLPPDSAVNHPGSVYLGSPQKIYLRYGFDYKKRTGFGFTLEKDAGEVMFGNSLPDTVRRIVADKISPLFDFGSAYAYVSDIGFVKKALIGDYHLEFGQGLTLWSGLSFGLSADGTSVKKFGRGIRPNTSVNENRFFRGAATEIEIKNFTATAFYSKKGVDANIRKDTSENIIISGIQETGNHRTVNELYDKHGTTVTAYGGHIGFRSSLFSLGATAYKTILSPPLFPDNKPYKKFAFSGSELFTYGFDANAVAGKWDFFGEFSANASGGTAGLAGVNAYLDDRFLFTLLYRNIGKSYHNFYNNPIAENSSYEGESGLYLGVNALLTRMFSLAAYTDYFNNAWLKYRIDAPSQGRIYAVQLNYTPMRNIESYFRFRYKQKQENSAAEGEYISVLKDVRRFEWRWNLSWQPAGFLIFKNRIEYVRYRKNNCSEKGYLIYQDILYRPVNFPLQITLRYALFDTDGWNSRIYAYENDVLYAFSIPAYYDKGERFYFMIKWNTIKNINIWLRFAHTRFFNKTQIGNGADLINGHDKSDVKIQLIWKI